MSRPCTRGEQDIPTDVLQEVLGHVELSQRLGCCALVSTKWRKAAATATSSIQWHMSGRVPLAYQRWARWMVEHGKHVTSLSFSGGAHVTMKRLQLLPNHWLSQLRELKLSMLTIELKSSSFPALLSGATRLTHLTLEDCCMLRPCILSPLSALTSLRHLSLVRLKGGSSFLASTTDLHAEEPSLVPGSLLPNLVQLTNLTLVGHGVTDATLRHLSCLSALRVLMIHAGGTVTAAPFLRQSNLHRLGHLVLYDVTDAVFGCSSSVGSFSQLEALQCLELIHCGGLVATALRSMKQLGKLALFNTPIAGGAAGMSDLLAVLPQLVHLTDLTVGHRDDAPAPAAAYAAISACSQLQQLSLSSREIVPEAWQHMRASGGLLLQLRSLLFGVQEEQRDKENALVSRDLECMVQCCPALQQLFLVEALKPDVEATELLPLSASLTHLSMAGVNNMCATTVAQLTGLVQLNLCRPSSISDSGLLVLTELRKLCALVSDGDFSEELQATLNKRFVLLCRPYANVSLCNQAPKGRPPDVWQQVLECCMCSSICQSIIILDNLI